MLLNTFIDLDKNKAILMSSERLLFLAFGFIWMLFDLFEKNKTKQ